MEKFITPLIPIILILLAITLSNTCFKSDVSRVQIVEDYNDINSHLVYDITTCNKDSNIIVVEDDVNIDIEIITQYLKKKNYNLPETLRRTIAKETINKCEEYNIPVSIILGIMDIESNFNPMAVSSKKARGLMQVLDNEVGGEKIDKNRLHDVAYNIEHGIKILKDKLRISKNSLDEALFLYVGRDKEYPDKIFRSVGEYIFYKSSFNL